MTSSSLDINGISNLRLNPRLMAFQLTSETRLRPGDDSALDGVSRKWTLEAHHRGVDDKRTVVGYSELRVFDIGLTDWDRHRLLLLADEEGWDLMDIFEHDWMDLIEVPPVKLIVAERTYVKPEFRGHGLGPLIAGMALDGLNTGMDYAVCFPAPIEDRPDVSREDAISSLGRTWAKIGFTHLVDGIWGLDLTSTAFDDALERVTDVALSNLPDTFEDVDADDEADEAQGALERLKMAVNAFQIADTELAARLWHARRAGLSWKEIADGIGTTQKWIKAFRPDDTVSRHKPSFIE